MNNVLGLEIVKKMPPDKAAALIADCNLSFESYRTISRHLRVHFNGQSVLPGEKDIKNLVSNANLPECQVITYENKKIRFYFDGVDTAIKRDLPLVLDGDVLKEATTVDVLCSGDHGAGYFRAAVKLLFRNQNRKKVRTYTLWLGMVDCPKDSYQLLNASIFRPWNDSLKRLLKERVMIIDQNSDPSTQKDHPYFLSFSDSIPDQSSANIFTVTLDRILITGDIAFYATCLGKEHSSGSWCWICRLSHKQWQPVEEERTQVSMEDARLWTIKELCEHAESLLEEGSLTVCKKTEASVSRGVKYVPPIDALDIIQFVIPTLHLKLGLVNAALKNFKQWIDTRIENMPADLLQARTNFIIIELKHSRSDEDMTSLKDEIADLMMQKSYIKTALKEKNFQNKFVLPTGSPERKEAHAKHKDFEQRLAYLRREKKIISERIDVQ